MYEKSRLSSVNFIFYWQILPVKSYLLNLTRQILFVKAYLLNPARQSLLVKSYSLNLTR